MGTRVPGVLFCLAALAQGSGCGRAGSEDISIAHMIDAGSDSDTESASETESLPDDTGSCPDETSGACVRYVNWQAAPGSGCGTSWDSAFPTVQEGIDSAYAATQWVARCQVWVAQGRYDVFVAGREDTITLRPNVEVYGGFEGKETLLSERDPAARATVLDGRGKGGVTNRVYHVVTGSDAALLDGFTVTGGKADGATPDDRGGGLLLHVTSPTVKGCRFVDNEAKQGGGVYMYESWPVLETCSFVHNMADEGGGLYMLNSSPKLNACTFEDNRAVTSGGGLHALQLYGVCGPTVEGSAFTANRSDGVGGGVASVGCGGSLTGTTFKGNLAGAEGGGMSASAGPVKVESCVFEGNEAMNGGGVASAGEGLEIRSARLVRNEAVRSGGGLFNEDADTKVNTCVFENNRAGEEGGAARNVADTSWFVSTVFTGNRAARGGAMSNGMDSRPSVFNDTFEGNVASECGGAIYNDMRAAPAITNCILWDDEVKEICNAPDARPVVTYSDVEGGYPGLQNLDAKPRFAAPGRTDDIWIPGDYNLKAKSPCIDTGDNTVVPLTDADGKPWADVPDAGIPGAFADIGAYEYKP
ncbi:MAG: right-handed parallel beta-helix repeat-containing protein [Deltaproteobacteria bacterium]|nr:right-handed parallel beta-helix repeat-containing protein [Deltaproteobacteria bacterium]